MKYRQPRSGKGGGHPDRDQKRGEPRRGQTPPFTINAPYNFVPLSETVVTPDWANLVSHDVPFKDGLCGELHFTIETKSPLLVGGKRRKATSHEEGEVWFHKNTSGQFEIPGSSLEGMVRNVFEIATFSRMKLVDDKRFGLRDISSPRVKKSYMGKVKGKVKAGFLERGPIDGKPRIYACTMARVHKQVLRNYLDEDLYGKTVNEKYADLEKKLNRKGFSTKDVYFTTNGKDPDDNEEVVQLSNTPMNGSRQGRFVLTGHIGNKKKEFIFHCPCATVLDVHSEDPKAWADFQFIHGDGENSSSMSWPGFWKKKYHAGEKVPVFYVHDPTKKRLRIALAYLPKFAGDFSVRDMIGHTSQVHLVTDGRPDMTDLVFGLPAGDDGGGLKGRLHFRIGRLKSPPTVRELVTEPKVLASPKPSFFPNYLVQDADLVTAQYHTYLDVNGQSPVRIRGWKRYPVRQANEVSELKEKEGTTKATQVILHPLQEGCQFSASVSFHNLKPIELGALIWSLRFGRSEQHRHSLGMGKPLGYGQVQVSIDEESGKLIPNDPVAKADTLDQYVDCFKKYMDTKVANESKVGWEATEQINVLTAMADINERNRFKGELKYMPLTDYRKAKRDGAVLGSYKADNKKR